MLQPDVSLDKSKKIGSTPKKVDTRSRSPLISERFIALIRKRLEAGKRVARSLPGWGRIHIDRQLPFLCVYRRPVGVQDMGTEQLVTGQASYLIAAGDRKYHKGLSLLIEQIATTMQEVYGAFLIVEVWSGLHNEGHDSDPLHKPTFRIVASKKTALMSTVDELAEALCAIKIQEVPAIVDVALGERPQPTSMPVLLTSKKAREIGCHFLGLTVKPIYRDPDSGTVFPLVLRTIKRGMTRAYRRGFFDFVHNHTLHQPAHFHSLGPRAIVKVVWQVDTQLAEVSNVFDLLLALTPTNIHEAWLAFKRSKYERPPEFTYRRLPFDPSLLKRQLYKIPIDRIEDPTLSDLFSKQQYGIDQRISMMVERGTVNVLYGSLQAYGPVDHALYKTAVEILSDLPARSREPKPAVAVDANTLANHARDELNYLRRTHPEINSGVEVRKDIIGLMVSRGDLLIGADTKVPQSRVRALLAHELGTHVVTYLNGRAQPFKQLYVGLPGYDELQEGLAVMAEYLVGGLSRPRMRLLAGRVAGVAQMIDGASFVDVFRELHTSFGFTKRIAFNMAVRFFRGGGLTKDAVYLRGLLYLLDYIRQGGRIESLYVGKFALEHLPIIEELQLRHVLGPARLRPPYLDDEAALNRLDRIRKGTSILTLIKEAN